MLTLQPQVIRPGLSNLPFEILEIIATSLSQEDLLSFACVNQRCRAIARPLLQIDYDISLDGVASVEMLTYLQEDGCLHNVFEINLRNLGGLTFKERVQLARCLSQTERVAYLHIDSTTETDSSFLLEFNRICVVSLTRGCWDPLLLRDILSARKRILGSSNIGHLDLSHNPQITPAIALSIASNLRSVTHFDISFCSPIPHTVANAILALMSSSLHFFDCSPDVSYSRAIALWRSDVLNPRFPVIFGKTIASAILGISNAVRR